ncbi:MAG: HAD hydrolase-like protein [Nitrososphaeria archaeon]|nr:HAD hydrolase-like protein [Nitrosopumilaceae archaeon]NIP10481.1 HAD hydrolase-like protein [Nitrosopumilaceae archaeon]NIP90863.1 HAD hydrolase-like protein [Nitrososphaeria archaeon]NIS95124.1 HAD hydrolase-like protein [Nitrosopumilaceae archaeon]
MTLTKKQEGIYIDDSILDSIRSSDGLIFDCDGVLIDITKSYDLTIKKTTKLVLERFANISDSIEIDSKIIDGFKSTGGFNDEVDVTYASIISLIAAKKLGRDQKEFIFEVIKHCDSSGINSAEKYIEDLTEIEEIKNKLEYPGAHHDNPLYQIFDQLFYGPELYEKLFQRKSEFTEPPLIDNDLVIISENLITKLQTKFGPKISIVTGRGKESVRYSLRNLMEKFDLENSAFLEDESRQLAKPNPLPLTRAISGMAATNSIYVGDSMEDLIMAKKATEQGLGTIFCGIVGTSKNPQQKLELFQKNGAQLILESIDLLPKVLNLE